jgi:orotidine-5'-phosphate decarboxylase
MKPTLPEERLILALDVPTREDALNIIAQLGGHIKFFKIGLQLFMASHFEIVDYLGDQGFKVFLDLKLYDIPNTVVQALSIMSKHPVTFTTLHAERSILKAGVEATQGKPGILAVTVLTSMDPMDFEAEYGKSVERVVIERAQMARDTGCAGVIASGKEASLIRNHCGEKLLIISPGIRAQGADKQDQKRVITAFDAIRNGADYIVVGRPILKAADPKKAVVEIIREIEKAMREK